MSDPQPGPYYSHWGPKDGPIRHRDNPPAMGVVAEPGGGSLPLGIAYPRTYRLDPRGSIALFRLVVYKVGVPGLWECVGREFIPAAEGGVGGAYPPPRTGAR